MGLIYKTGSSRLVNRMSGIGRLCIGCSRVQVQVQVQVVVHVQVEVHRMSTMVLQ